MNNEPKRDNTLPPIFAEYAKMGYPLFPCEVGGKRPIVGSWLAEATTDLKQIRQWWAIFPGCNFGLHLGEATIPTAVVDCDGEEGIKNAKAILGDNFDGATVVRTPGGGLHVYYTGEVRNTVAKLAKKVDTRGARGYVLAPGSVIDGRTYEVIHEAFELPPLPDAVKQAASRTPKPSAEVPEGVDIDTELCKKLARRYLTHAAPCAIEGDGGNSQTFAVACHVRDYGISQGRCLDLMLACWNDEKASPPWGPEELAKIIANAYRYATTEKPGINDPSLIFDDVSHLQNDPLAPLYNIRQRTAEYFLALGKPPERRWLIEGWIPGETSTHTLLTGRGGIGKSLIAVQMGIAIGGGSTEIWGSRVAEHRPVLAVFCEDSEIDLRHRLWDMASTDPEFRKQMDKSDFRLISRTTDASNHMVIQEGVTLRQGPLWNDLKAELMHMGEGPKFCILDTVSDIFGADPNDNQLVQQFLKAKLNHLAAQTNTTFMLIGHPAKAVGSQVSGAAAWVNAVRNHLFIDYANPEKPGNRIQICRTKSNWAGIGEPLDLEYSKEFKKYVFCDNIEVRDMAKHAVLHAIVRAAELNVQLYYKNTGSSGSRYIGSAVIKPEESGEELTKDEIMRAVDDLLRDGSVEVITGDKKGRNGLWPIKPEDVFDDASNNSGDEIL